MKQRDYNASVKKKTIMLFKPFDTPYLQPINNAIKDLTSSQYNFLNFHF